MPFVLWCPTCRNALTVHESQIGTIVSCPTCRYPLTVPLQSPSPIGAAVLEPEPDADLDFSPEESEGGQRPSHPGNGFIASVLFVGLWWFLLVLMCLATDKESTPFVVATGVVGPMWLWYFCQVCCPNCGQRIWGWRWDESRKDGGPDRRFKHNACRCGKCGHVRNSY